MAVENLFAKCPVLPADTSISIAKYLRSIKQALKQSSESEESGDVERATLLQIRVLQLICKTLPTHPEYELAENRPVLKELRGIAHTSFFNVERLANLLDGDRTSRSRSPSRRRRALQHVEVSRGLVELFERIAAENTAKALCTIGILAGRRAGEDSSGQSTDETAITALVIPSQISLPDRSDVRYESDVSQLLEVKGLLPFGCIELRPNENKLAASVAASRVLAAHQRSNAEVVAIVIAPGDSERVGAFSLTEDGLRYVSSCIENDSLPEQTYISGEEGSGTQAIWSRGRHLNIAVSGEPFFKLYDLRPLAIARDQEERNARQRSN